MEHVEEYVESTKRTLQACTGETLNSKDFNDDRLANILKYLSNDTLWQTFETAINQNTIRVYKLSDNKVRLDSTTENSYSEPEGLFQ